MFRVRSGITTEKTKVVDKFIGFTGVVDPGKNDPGRKKISAI
jgi:hypothetical protein